jgi:hypothetical protein
MKRLKPGSQGKVALTHEHQEGDHLVTEECTKTKSCCGDDGASNGMEAKRR